jgi:hypothetical protein
MSTKDEDRDRVDEAREAAEPHDTDTPDPERSDQAPGEAAVQVNDAYRGGGPPPEREPGLDDDQHRTGG